MVHCAFVIVAYEISLSIENQNLRHTQNIRWSIRVLAEPCGTRVHVPIFHGIMIQLINRTYCIICVAFPSYCSIYELRPVIRISFHPP